MGVSMVGYAWVNRRVYGWGNWLVKWLVKGWLNEWIKALVKGWVEWRIVSLWMYITTWKNCIGYYTVNQTKKAISVIWSISTKPASDITRPVLAKTFVSIKLSCLLSRISSLTSRKSIIVAEYRPFLSSIHRAFKTGSASRSSVDRWRNNGLTLTSRTIFPNISLFLHSGYIIPVDICN